MGGFPLEFPSFRANHWRRMVLCQNLEEMFHINAIIRLLGLVGGWEMESSVANTVILAIYFVPTEIFVSITEITEHIFSSPARWHPRDSHLRHFTEILLIQSTRKGLKKKLHIANDLGANCGCLTILLSINVFLPKYFDYITGWMRSMNFMMLVMTLMPMEMIFTFYTFDACLVMSLVVINI